MSELTVEEFEKRFAEFRKKPKPAAPPPPLDPIVPFFLKMLEMLRMEGQYEAEAREIATAMTSTGVDWGNDWDRLRRVGSVTLGMHELREFPTKWTMPSQLPKIVNNVLVFPPPKPLPPPLTVDELLDSSSADDNTAL